jgi:hypothetical protein
LSITSARRSTRTDLLAFGIELDRSPDNQRNDVILIRQGADQIPNICDEVGKPCNNSTVGALITCLAVKDI